MAAYWELSRNAPIGRLVSIDTEVAVRLGPGEVFTLTGDRRGWRIDCAEGQLWITQADDPADYILRQGQYLNPSKAGTIVVQGMPRGEARISAPGPIAPARTI